ncbi:CBO0543 family protein [Sporomusa termitida]|nr:CBO0543 family protein [Sporomusa termitida]
MVVNLASSFITYHHILWNYNPDIFVRTQTTIELLNAFVLLPAVAFIFLSLFPFARSKVYQAGYIALWILIFSCIELVAHYIVGSLSYKNQWSWFDSFIFDIALFSVTRLHYSRPFWAWGISLIITVIIYTGFGFSAGEFK